MNHIETPSKESPRSVFSTRDRVMLKDMLKSLRRSVHLMVFVDDDHAAVGARDLAGELQRSAAGHLRVDVLPMSATSVRSLASLLGVRYTPTWRFVSPSGEVGPIEFIGLPTGYQFGAFLSLILDLSQNHWHLNHGLHGAFKSIPTDVLIEIIVTATCPNCPQVVRLAYECALANPARLHARVIDGNQYPALVPPEAELVPYTRVSIPHQGLTQDRIGMMTSRDLLTLIQTSVKGGPLSS